MELSREEIRAAANKFFEENFKLEEEKRPEQREIPNGRFRCKIISTKFFNSSQKGTPGLKLTFRIIQGEYEGGLLWYDIWLTPKCRTRNGKHYGELGIEGPRGEIDLDRTYDIWTESNHWAGKARTVIESFEHCRR